MSFFAFGCDLLFDGWDLNLKKWICIIVATEEMKTIGVEATYYPLEINYILQNTVKVIYQCLDYSQMCSTFSLPSPCWVEMREPVRLCRIFSETDDIRHISIPGIVKCSWKVSVVYTQIHFLVHTCIYTVWLLYILYWGYCYSTKIILLNLLNTNLLYSNWFSEMKKHLSSACPMNIGLA